MKKTLIMLVEDHPEYRDAIEMALKRESDLELDSLFGMAETALRAIQDRKAERPDIVLLDLNLPGMSGIEALPWFREYCPKAKIIVLTQSDAESDVVQAIRLGASGYLLKSSTLKQIKEGIRSVVDGGAPLDSAVARFILDTLRLKPLKEELKTSLSEREMEILSLLADGLSKKQIASQLKIGTTTVVTHVNHIYEKLEATNAPSAVSKAYRLGLFPEDSER